MTMLESTDQKPPTAGFDDNSMTYMRKLVYMTKGDPQWLAFWLNECLIFHRQACEELGIVDRYDAAKRECLDMFMLACQSYFETIGRQIEVTLVNSVVRDVFMVRITFIRIHDGKQIDIQLCEGSNLDWPRLSAS